MKIFLKCVILPILWNSVLIMNVSDVGKDWKREEKGMTEDEMVGWHHPVEGHEFEQTPRVGDGQGSLVCCSPWGRKELDMTEQLNWTDWAHRKQPGSWYPCATNPGSTYLHISHHMRKEAGIFEDSFGWISWYLAQSILTNTTGDCRRASFEKLRKEQWWGTFGLYMSPCLLDLHRGQALPLYYWNFSKKI